MLNEAAKDGAFYNRGARVKLLHFPSAAAAKTIDLPALNVADGLSNSWPRWSPFVQTYKGKKILWLTFSSNRDYGLHLINKGFDNCYPPSSPLATPYGTTPQPPGKKGVLYDGCGQPQIWMAGVVVEEDDVRCEGPIVPGVLAPVPGREQSQSLGAVGREDSRTADSSAAW